MKEIGEYRKLCDCGEQVKHNDGGRYHPVSRVIEYSGNYYTLDTDTRDRFPSDSTVIVQNEGGLEIKDGERLRMLKDTEEEIIDWVKDGDRLKGPFDSKEEAMDNAKKTVKKRIAWKERDDVDNMDFKEFKEDSVTFIKPL